MSVKPIDLQTNMSHISDVGKTEQARNEALVQQQHGLGSESTERSRLVNSRLEESKKGEGSTIRDKEAKEGKMQGREKKERRKEEQKAPQKKPYRDDKLGRIIDVFK